MVRVTCVLVAVLALAHDVAADICSAADICYEQGLLRRCDRTKRTDCPPCLFENEINDRYECYARSSGVCPPETTLCLPSEEPSGSGSSSTTPEPTTTEPPTEPPSSGSESESESESESGSGTPTPKPTQKTPEPTTKKPVTTAPPTETPTPSPSMNVTEAPIVTAAPIDTNSSSGGGLSMPLLVGIIGAAVVVVAVMAFFIWKRKRDDDDDSDDDDDFRFKNPPATYNPRGAGGAPAYANSNLSRTVTSPLGRGGNYGGSAPYGADRYGGAAGAGAAAGYGGGAKYAGATEYSSGGMYGAQYGAQADYGIPTNLNGDDRDLYTGAGGLVYENRDSLSSAENSRDVWGNAVTKNTQGQPSRPVPTSRNVQATQRENRTLSNVSIEL